MEARFIVGGLTNCFLLVSGGARALALQPLVAGHVCFVLLDRLIHLMGCQGTLPRNLRIQHMPDLLSDSVQGDLILKGFQLHLRELAPPVLVKVAHGGAYPNHKVGSILLCPLTKVFDHVSLGCTGLYLDVAGHMVAFYGKKGHSKAGLLQEQGIQASQAIATIPTWLGYPATWRVRCVSVAEANEIVTACKRLERENWRRAHWELQHRFSTMRLGSSLSAVAKPFQPQATSSSMLVASAPQGPVDPAGPRESSPAAAAIGTPVRRGSPVSHHASDEGETSPDTSIPDRTSRRRHARRGNRSCYSSSDSDDSHASAVRRKKKDGFSNKIQIPEFGGKKGHPQDVARAFRQWARCITYYRDYYEDSYLMPLVVSSLTGDASDVFDWTRSLTPGDPQDLSALLQMLREHYCGSFTFRERVSLV